MADQNHGNQSVKTVARTVKLETEEVAAVVAIGHISSDSSFDETESSELGSETYCAVEKYTPDKNNTACAMDSAQIAPDSNFVDTQDDTTFAIDSADLVPSGRRSNRAPIDIEKNKAVSMDSAGAAVAPGARIDRAFVDIVDDSAPAMDSANAVPSRRKTDYSFVDIEDDTLFSDTQANSDSKSTNEIVKAVQERLFDFSSSKRKEVPFATNDGYASSDDQKSESAEFRSWLPASRINRASTKSKRKTMSRSQTLASKVDRSNDEDDVDVDVGLDQKSKKTKLFAVYIFLSLVIVASIICAVLFAVELRRSRASDPSSIDDNGENSGDWIESQPKTTLSPVESPSYDSSLQNSPPSSGNFEGLPFETQAPSSSSLSSQSNYPSDSVSEGTIQISPRITPSSESSPSQNDEKQQTPTVAPSLYSGSVEETLRTISGETIYDTSTPQHNAYDWLVREESGSLDLMTEQDLKQRYIAMLLYFALDGGNWFEQYGFLEESHVCKWNNGSSRNKLGVICDSSNTITGFAISK
jgi:hypothetical protein